MSHFFGTEQVSVHLLIDIRSHCSKFNLFKFGFIGFGGGKLASIVDVSIVVESNHMGRVEDMHVILMHLICYYFIDE